MHPRFLFLNFFFIFLFCASLFGQQKHASKVFLAEKYHFFQNHNDGLSHENFFAEMAGEMKLSTSSEMVLSNEVVGENGMIHFKYKQFHGGLPIYGNTYVLHEKNGKVKYGGGLFTPMIDLDLTPSISAHDAILYAKKSLGAQEYEAHKTEPELCLIDPAFPNKSEYIALAYQVEIHSVEPFDKQRFFVNAMNGEIISQFPMIIQHGVPSTGVTRYYGTQNIITDSLAPDYFELHDPTRGDGITVRQLNGLSFTNESSTWDLTNDDKDEVALDAHYCTTEYYDMMLSDFDWDGLDGEGGELIARVHYSNANAYWDGVASTYGDGNCIYGPLTTLEVVGHEFTHGMIDYTSNLIYSGESGAINESMADIMGKTLEYNSDPDNFSWELGRSFIIHPDGEPFRVMNDPASVDMPDFYQGTLWNDNAGVHTNSAIGNLWFHMLVDGKQGVNEAGVNYNVPSIGIDKASQIAFLTNKAYLTESSNYNDFYLFSLIAAEELYGAGSSEVMAVEEAWGAVGLPNGTGGSQPDFDLTIYQPSTVQSTFCNIGEYASFVVEVANLGLEPYLPSSEAEFVISTFGVDDYSQIITDTIQPGEVLTIVVDDWYLIENSNAFFITVDLNYNDEVSSNNSYTEIFNVSEYPSSDLELDGELISQGCFNPVYQAGFYIFNSSCEVLPAGTTFDLQVEKVSGGIVWNGTFVADTDMLPFRNTIAFYEIEIPDLLPQEELRFSVDFNDDPYPDNNSSFVTAPNIETISDDYLNNFNGILTEDNTIDISSVVSYQGEYQGEPYFGSTGLYTDYQYFTPCPDFMDNFDSGNQFNGLSTTLRACLDFTLHDEPSIEFDVVQFRNEIAVAEGNIHSCVLQAEWSGDETTKEYILGQDEGEIYHYAFDLPANFKGELELEFYTELGEWAVDEFAYDNYDVLLLDNLELKTNYVNSIQEVGESKVRIFPNPSNGTVRINSNEIVNEIELINLDGKRMRVWKVNSNVIQLDINEIKGGVYFLQLENDSGEEILKKLVKM